MIRRNFLAFLQAAAFTPPLFDARNTAVSPRLLYPLSKTVFCQLDFFPLNVRTIFACPAALPSLYTTGYMRYFPFAKHMLSGVCGFGFLQTTDLAHPNLLALFLAVRALSLLPGTKVMG